MPEGDFLIWVKTVAQASKPVLYLALITCGAAYKSAANLIESVVSLEEYLAVCYRVLADKSENNGKVDYGDIQKKS